MYGGEIKACIDSSGIIMFSATSLLDVKTDSNASPLQSIDSILIEIDSISKKMYSEDKIKLVDLTLWLYPVDERTYQPLWKATLEYTYTNPEQVKEIRLSEIWINAFSGKETVVGGQNSDIFNCLKIDILRSIFSVRFLISVIGYSVLLYANLPIDPWPLDATYLFSMSYKYGFYVFFFLCAAIPYSTSYLKDIENGYLQSVVRRIPSSTYGLSKCIATTVSGMLAVILSTTIFIVILNIRFTSMNISSISFSGWDVIITKYNSTTYFVVKTFLTALYGGCFALISLVVSTKSIILS